jgi:hypothetical protein
VQTENNCTNFSIDLEATIAEESIELKQKGSHCKTLNDRYRNVF